jgi:DNA (cytosine-5)-methyltransferase 1
MKTLVRNRPSADLPVVGVVDFFSGCGGTSLGLQTAGMHVLLGLDSDADAARSFGVNFAAADVIAEDIRDVTPSRVRRLVEPAEVDHLLFAACAPCQPFSKQRREKVEDDDRTDLLLEFVRFVKKLKPTFVFVENVPGLQEFDPSGGPFQLFLDTLDEAGYDWTAEVVDSRSYGVPQKRQRLVVLASLLGPIDVPQPTHGPGTRNAEYATVREWIGSLPPLRAGEKHVRIRHHEAANLSAVNLKRIAATPEGRGRESWPARLRLKCHDGHTGHSDVYGRMRWDAPASGLTTRCISLSNGRFGHPTQDRAISVREAASLQTFPRKFSFVGAMASMARQIGNAVPPLMAKRFGEEFLRHAQEAEQSDEGAA